MYPVLIPPTVFINRPELQHEALWSSRINRKPIGYIRALVHPENPSDLLLTIRLISRSSGTRPEGMQSRLNIYKNDPDLSSNVRKEGIADIEIRGWKLRVKGESHREV